MSDKSKQMLALVLREAREGIVAAVEELPVAAIPTGGDTTVRVLFSSLNYKDALAITNRGKIVRGDYPFVPGIDLVGEVVETSASDFAPGDLVIGTGWGIGEEYWGGYSEWATLRSSWLVPLPEDMAPEDAMGIGTAGFTAMLSVLSFERCGVHPGSGEVVVTGATGGVGSFATLLLSSRGYRVVASTGKDAVKYLSQLGASRVIDRKVLGSGAKRALDSGIWAGAIDSVGGRTLEALLSQTRRHGCVAACGLAGGSELNTTVFPFILRGVQLVGIDSNTAPMELRRRAWQCLANEADRATIRNLTRVVELADLPAESEKLLAGDLLGRLIVRVAGG